MSKVATHEYSSDRRQGIALVVVLGFLSILVLMAVALVTLTRTERLVAATSVEGARSKILTRGVVGAAMDAINKDFWGAQRIHPSEDRAVFESQGAGGRIGDKINLFRGEATNWLPRKYVVPTVAGYNVSNIWASSAEWIPVYDPATNILLGRYGFLVVDCTGLLDANVIAEPDVTWSYVNQLIRNNARHVPVDALPEANAASPAFETSRRLISNRNNYHGFATFREIAVFNDGFNIDFPFAELHAIHATNLNNLAPFSLSYDSGWWDWTLNRWQRGMPGIAPENVNDWTAGQAQALFQNLGCPSPSDMALCFMDFVDSDSLPGVTGAGAPRVDIPCGEAIPMISEIGINGSVSLNAGVATLNLTVQVETWFPFPVVQPSPDTYQVVGPRVGAVGSDIAFLVMGPSGPVGLAETAPSAAAPQFTPVPNEVRVNQFTYNGIVLPGITSGVQLQVGFLFGRVRLANVSAGSVDVDQVTLGPDKAVGPFPVSVPVVDPGTLTFSGQWPKSVAVDDPRLNHISARWGVASPVSLGVTNAEAIAAGAEEGLSMFVRNGPLQSVAELGFIPTGLPWQTVDLCSSTGRILLSRFRVDDPIVDKFWTNGCLNPNTLFPDTLVAAFYGVDSGEVPGLGPPGQPWTDINQIRVLTGAMYSNSTHTSITGANSFDSPAGWVAVTNWRCGKALSYHPALRPTGLNNNRREAIIRNSYKMFTPTENLYTVFAVAQTFQDGETNAISGEKRAVALVWRDPFPNTDGRHEWFIRQFRWLED